jgi:hypothetical protein
MTRQTGGVIRKVGPRAEPIAPARKVLAEKLKQIFEARSLNSTKAAKLSGVSQRTIHDMVALAHDPALGNVDKVGRSLGLSAWQLLIPDSDLRAFELWRIYQATTDEGRRTIDFAMEFATKELNRVKEKGVQRS